MKREPYPSEPRSLRAAVVTGPTGAIGYALCARLLRAGVRVAAVCRPGTLRAEELAALPGVFLTECDISALSRLPEKLPAGADAFFHLAWEAAGGTGRNDMDAQVRNIRGTLDACRAAAALGCSVFVGAGSQAEYGRVNGPLRPDTPCAPENGYGMAKLCAGQMSRVECRKLGLAHIWARILSVYGPHDGESSMISAVIRQLLAGEKPALTAGEQLWDYLYSADAAEALYRMALYGHDGAIYPLGSGEARPLREYVEKLRNAIDPALPLDFGLLPYGEGQVMRLEADLGALRRDTGFFPAMDFSEGIRTTVRWMKGGQAHA